MYEPNDPRPERHAGESRLDQASEWVAANRSNWIRGLLMLLFVFVFELVQLATGLMAVVQFVVLLVTGAPNEQLRRVGAALAVYSEEIVAFLTCATEDVPFPFSPWPRAGG